MVPLCVLFLILMSLKRLLSDTETFILDGQTSGDIKHAWSPFEAAVQTRVCVHRQRWRQDSLEQIHPYNYICRIKKKILVNDGTALLMTGDTAWVSGMLVWASAIHMQRTRSTQRVKTALLKNFAAGHPRSREIPKTCCSVLFWGKNPPREKDERSTWTQMTGEKSEKKPKRWKHEINHLCLYGETKKTNYLKMEPKRFEWEWKWNLA